MPVLSAAHLLALGAMGGAVGSRKHYY